MSQGEGVPALPGTLCPKFLYSSLLYVLLYLSVPSREHELRGVCLVLGILPAPYRFSVNICEGSG